MLDHSDRKPLDELLARLKNLGAQAGIDITYPPSQLWLVEPYTGKQRPLRAQMPHLQVTCTPSETLPPNSVPREKIEMLCPRLSEHLTSLIDGTGIFEGKCNISMQNLSGVAAFFVADEMKARMAADTELTQEQAGKDSVFVKISQVLFDMTKWSCGSGVAKIGPEFAVPPRYSFVR